MNNRRRWTPYLLLLPTVLFLALFFLYPMVQALKLSVWSENTILALKDEADRESGSAGRLPRGTTVTILDREGNLIPPDESDTTAFLTERWFYVRGDSVEGETIEGWTSDSRIRVREEAADGTPLMGTVRRVLGSGADPLTRLYTEADDDSPLAGQMEANTEVSIVDLAILEVWYQVQGTVDDETVTGWAPSRFIQAFEGGDQGRVDRGNAGEFTMDHIRRMVQNRFFWPALRTTVLLMVIIIPIQFVLAIIMALVIQARLRGNNWLLYIFAIPLGVSDLAVGIVWFAIFTQNGFLNSILDGIGLIAGPRPYLTASTRGWIIFAIVLAEVWRATSIVMIIVVSGLQAISQEVLEAAELFGATLWQRVRHVILPLLKPSLQVALILRTILALQVFAVVVALSGGDIVTVLANETYRQYVELRNPNLAAAYAGLILVMSMVSAMIYLRLVRTQEEAGL
ncbi:MAG: sugar ABC transporter permease [Anaerolineae bacterium]|nr:sugar ABC transporter permease [Anaerolineae bacterium]